MKKKRVLICPLDWGLGHATRCIPIIRELLDHNIEVIIAADGRPLELLKQEFPLLKHIIFPGYQISYPSSGNMILSMFLQAPKILKGIWREHLVLKKLIIKDNIDAVISDNRYGLWNKKIPTVFITHQLMIKCPEKLKFFEPFLHAVVMFFAKKFNFCWVPDYKSGENLSGDLSHKFSVPKNAFFIGPLSRLKKPGNIEANKRVKLCVLISGPEPQRTTFEEKIISQVKDLNVSTVIVSGKPEKSAESFLTENIRIISHLNTSEMEQLLCSAELVISRSGYSTIMDLAALGKKAVFVPTPGQTEQEYLANKFFKESVAYFEDQEKFSLERLITASKYFKGFSPREGEQRGFMQAIDSFVKGL